MRFIIRSLEGQAMEAPQVKICGITNLEDAEAALAAGADALGLNFFPGSPRCLVDAEARRIAEKVDGRAELWGVFVNES